MRGQRPALRWHGGKWLLAPWIIDFFPPHRIYVEPFGGAASVLLRKPRAYGEIYNDLDSEVVNLFRVLRSPVDAERLIWALTTTPFARDEFELAYALELDPVEQARRLVVRSFMGFGSDGHNRLLRTGFRSNSNRAGTTPAHDWMNFPDALEITVKRLRSVVIENRPALQVMAHHDSPETLHYVDPPYLPTTRSQKSRKSGELLQFLNSASGMVVLSGYPAPLYEEALTGWERHEREALADGARPRTEVVWLNPACVAARALAAKPKPQPPEPHPDLFAGD